MARPTATRTSDAAPRRRRSPALPAVAAALIFGVGAWGSGLFDEAPAEEHTAKRGASAAAERAPDRRPVHPAGTAPAPHPTHPAASQLVAGVTPHATPAHELADHAPEASLAAHVDCQHGPGDLKTSAEYEALQAKAEGLVQQGTPAILEGLRDPLLRSWIGGALLEDLDAFSELDLVAGLAELAADREADRGLRELSLELIGRSPATDPATVTRLSDMTLDEAADEELRGMALSALRLLARERPDLNGQTRAALLSAAERATHPWMRADALDGVRSQGASPTQVARLIDYLGAQDLETRNGAARALSDVDPDHRQQVGAALERALLRETDPTPASTLLESALRVGRSDAQALIARLAQSAIVQRTPELSEQARDYLELLAAGETDPTRVIRAHQERVLQRLNQ